MLTQQQSPRTGAAAPCAARDSAPIRHHNDAATLDPSAGPAIFGSTALPVSRTPYDARLARARPAALGSGPWSAMLVEAQGLDRIGQVILVNRWVNRHLGYTSDQLLDGTGDMWSPAAVTLGRARGDCEDYAIAKMALLARLGFRARDLFLVLVRDGARRSDHAILAVRLDGKLQILDSATDEVRESSLVPDYFPVMSFAAGRAWLHGYRVRDPVDPLRVATADAHSDWGDHDR